MSYLRILLSLDTTLSLNTQPSLKTNKIIKCSRPTEQRRLKTEYQHRHLIVHIGRVLANYHFKYLKKESVPLLQALLSTNILRNNRQQFNQEKFHKL